jgi:hypothetical protein
VKKFLMNSLKYAPQDLRHRFYRSQIALNPTPPPQLRVKLATTRDELESAYRLLHDVYVESKFMRPDPSGMRVSVYNALPSTSTIIATWDGKVVGTVSVIRHTPLGVPLDKIFDIRPLFSGGKRVAEISALAVAKEFRRNSGEIFFPLMKFAYEYWIRYFGLDEVVIAVNPRHSEFYDALLFFRNLSNSMVTNYDFVNGNPAVGKRLNLQEALKVFSRHYGKSSRKRNLFSYFVELQMPNLHFPERRFAKISDPTLTPELYEYFFKRKTRLESQFSDREKFLLSRLYNHEKFASVFPFAMRSQSAIRHDVNCQAVLGKAGARVLNVSSGGFCLAGLKSVELNKTLSIQIALNNSAMVSLDACPVWADDQGKYGFSIQSGNEGWKEFIQYLDKDLLKVA